MTTYRPTWMVPLVLIAVGCASNSRHLAGPSALLEDEPTESANQIRQVDFEQTKTPELVQPPALSEEVVAPEESSNPNDSDAALVTPQRPPSADGLTLATLEQMAFSNNPTIAQSEARVRALRGRWVQVGLPPNPTAGYLAGEIGEGGSAGQQGFFVGQKYIRGEKLQRNRAIVAAEIRQAEQELVAQQRRVQTDVRQGYYEALLAQRRVELATELVNIAEKAAKSSAALVEAEEIPTAGLLQTEVQYQNALVRLRTSENSLAQTWQSLSAVVGGPDLPEQPLSGNVSDLPVSLGWEQQLARLQTESPEVAAAMANVERARRALDRANVEAVPDISTQVSVQYGDGSGDMLTGVQVGMPIPLWNKNQGGIRQAQAEVTEAVRNVDRVERNLTNRLSAVFRDLANAQFTAKTYQDEVLPRSQRTLELVQQGYEQGEVGYLDLLTAQQTFSQANLAYLDSLVLLWRSQVAIEGMLLKGSLEERVAPSIGT